MSNEHKIKASILNESSSIKASVQEASNNSISGNLTNTPTATTQTKGIIRIATDEEALAGELNNVAITPHTLDSVNSTNNAIINARIESLESSEDSEMEDIINIIQQRTINMIQLND